jgi:uncharacterized protein YjbJ (UPF0337 family)
MWMRKAPTTLAGAQDERLDGVAARALRDTAAEQTRSAADVAQEAWEQAKAEAGRRSVQAAATLSKLRDEAAPAITDLAGQGRDVAIQKAIQAKERLAPQVSVLKETATRQRQELAPVLEDWTGQARDRVSDLTAQAREEVLPVIAGLVDQTRGRIEQLSGQARDQFIPAAADLAFQARGRAKQLGSQTRDTASSLQASAGDLAPVVAGAASGTAATVGSAFDTTGRAVRSAVNGVFWLTVLTGIAVFLYAPKDEERAKLLAEVQGWFSYAVDIVTELRGGD